MANGLSDRVQQRAQGNGSGTPGKEVAVKSLRSQIEEMLPQFEMAMPKGFEAKQLMRDAFTLMRANPKLAECQPESVLGGLMTFAQLGLRPGVMGQGWLLPFKKRALVNGTWRDVYQAQIVIGYLGYVELIHRTGAIRKIVGRAVHENDFYEVEYGFNENITHRPPKHGPRGPVVRYYAIIFPVQGDPMFWDMTVEECLEWRAHYAMSTKKDRDGTPIRDANGRTTGSGPWYEMDGPEGGTGFDQQSIKTCFLRAKRFAPKSTDRMLTAAAEVDGAVRMSYKPTGPEDVDEMLTAEHPDPATAGDFIDGEVVEPQPPATTSAPAEPAPTQSPAADDSGAATQGQHRKIMALIGKHLTGDAAARDAHRHAVLGSILGRPIASGKELSGVDADRVFEVLRGWDGDKTLIARVAGMAPSPAGEAGGHPGAPAGEAGASPAGQADAPAGDLPAVGTVAWHDAGHPEDAGDGHIIRVPVLMNGDCGVCEEGQS